MRFLKSSPRKSEDDLSTQSSLRSMDSCELFGSACSDYSDCEYCDERRRQIKKKYSPSDSYCSAMSRLETTPLLGVLATRPAYKSLGDSTDTLGPGEVSSDAVLSTYKKNFEKTVKNENKKQSSLVTIFSIWNTIMGSSLLTMAWGVERAGLPAALVLVAVMAALCLYTAYILISVNAYHGSDTCSVQALCRLLLGGWAEALAHVFSVLVLLGANIVYWILITNFFYFTVNYFIDLSVSNATEYNTTLLCPNQIVNESLMIPSPAEESRYWGLHTTAPLYTALIVFPLLNFRNVSFFTKFNSLGTLSVFYLLIFVTVKGYAWGINMGALWSETHAARNAAVLSGMLALSFYIHNIIIEIMSNNARQDKNGRDLTIAFVLVTITYTMVGAVFYVCFPLAKSCIEDNILNNFERHDVMTAVARVLLLFQVVTVYPLVAYMLRTEAAILLSLRDTPALMLLVNVCIVVMCILFACFCPNIGTIIRYTGALSGLVHVFALPAALHVRSLHLRGELAHWMTLLYCLLVLAGAANLLMQFFITESNVGKFNILFI
ncbi:neutral amino acid transporter 9 isoform X2 [Bombyx mori]